MQRGDALRIRTSPNFVFKQKKRNIKPHPPRFQTWKSLYQTGNVLFQMGNATFQKQNAGFQNWNRGFQNRNHVFSNVPTWNRVTPAHIHIFRNWSGGMQKRNVHPGNGIVDCKTNSCCVQTMGRVSH